MFVVLFLDEPTSGLDSTAATEVVKCLQTIARVGNITVVCVIHQPRWDIFKLFDDVLFMGPGGTTVYQGPVERATHYFERIGFPVPPSTNPADYFLDVISGKVVGGKH
jgi:ABC-type multidrug transport system ATPase subunit